MADLRHLRFYGSNNGFFKNPVYDLSSIETIALNCLVFEKIAFFNLATDRQTDRQTNEQMDSTDSWSRSRERRLNKPFTVC